MSVLKKTLAATAALAFVSAPIAASAASAGSTARVAAPVKGKTSKLTGIGIPAAVAAALLVGLGIFVIADGKDKPKSP